MTRAKKAAGDPWALAAKHLDPLQYMEQIVAEHFTPPEDWAAWRVAIKDALGLPLAAEEVDMWRALSGRSVPPSTPALDIAWVMGRRAGKGRIAQLLAAHAATSCDWREILGPGEHAVVAVMAQTRAKAGDLHKGILALLEASPLTRGLIESVTDDMILLRNRVRIEVAAASFRTVRGGDSCVLFICDEVSSWYSAEQSANPDREIVAAVRPTLYTARAAGLGGTMLFISSPLGKKGTLWELYRDHFGKDAARTRVLQASTSTMHPKLSLELLADEIAADPAAARAEVFGLFRDDVIAYLTEDLLARAVKTGWTGEGPRPGVHCWAFVDPAGGSGGDSFVLGIARREARSSVVVRLDEYRPPFSATEAVAEMAATCAEYGIQAVHGDGFAGGTVADMFQRRGIAYAKEKRTKAQIFHDALPLFTSGLAVLPDHKRMAAQLLALERTTTRGSNRETIGAPRGGWDDVANAACGALLLAQRAPMFEAAGERARARQAAAQTATRDQHGAIEEIRRMNGVRVVFRVFEDGRAIPQRVAEEDETLEHTFTPCATCGGQHLVIGGVAALCPRDEPWTPTELMRRAVPVGARPDVRLAPEAGHQENLDRLAKTIGWAG
jgi:hypothetical protein